MNSPSNLPPALRHEVEKSNYLSAMQRSTLVREVSSLLEELYGSEPKSSAECRKRLKMRLRQLGARLWQDNATREQE